MIKISRIELNNPYTPGISAYFAKDVDNNGGKIVSISLPVFLIHYNNANKQLDLVLILLTLCFIILTHY